MINKIINKDINLLKAESDISKVVELHTVNMENGVMKMRQVKSILIKANSSIELKPGSFHIMFIGLKSPLKKDEKKELQQKKTELNNLINTEVKEQIKQKFDYQIPISEIKKAGINSTGGKEENQLPELLKAFTEYRTANNLWEVVK